MNPRIERLFKLAHLILPAFIAANEDVLGNRKGIYLGISWELSDIDSIPHGQIIGDLPEEKADEKAEFVFEKIKRMKNKKECCSFQSENEEKKQFGGGVLATEFYVAASGFPPHLDQKFCTTLCMLADEMTGDRYLEIQKHSSEQVKKWLSRN
jgi:hypothetical protein